jgi:hypothetical protein
MMDLERFEAEIGSQNGQEVLAASRSVREILQGQR